MSKPSPSPSASSKPESAADVKNPITPRTTVRRPPPPPYWHSYAGRNIVGGIATLGGCGICMGYTALHTMFLNRYKGVVQLHKNGFPTPLTPDMVHRCQETVSEVQVAFKNENIINFFSVFGMDMFHAGSLKLRAGSIIGLPRNFAYRSRVDIEKQEIMVENKPIEWGSDGGLMLQESLLLSARAQKFGIAREIMMTNTHFPLVYGCFATFSSISYLWITRTVNDKFYGLLRPKSFRYSVYSLAGVFCLGMWATATDMMTKYYERWADKKAGKISLDYAKGGVEFYSKILQRNMALRGLMGPSGEKMYTMYGNDVEFIRQSHVPFSERKKNMELLAEELSGPNAKVENEEE